MDSSESLCARIAPLFARARHHSENAHTLFQASEALARSLDGKVIDADLATTARGIVAELAAERALHEEVFPRLHKDEARGRFYAGFFFDNNSPYALAVPQERGDYIYKDESGKEQRGLIVDSPYPGRTAVLLVPFEPAA